MSGCRCSGLHSPVVRAPPGAGYYRRVSAGRPETSQAEPSTGICALLASEALTDNLVEGWSSTSTTLALGAGYFVVEADGSPWWNRAPMELHNKVNGWQKSVPPVDYVALRPDDAYFVQVQRVGRGLGFLVCLAAGTSRLDRVVAASCPSHGSTLAWHSTPP